MSIYLIILVIFCIGLILCLCWKKDELEGFIPGPCPNCGQRTKLQCTECSSCGWCLTPNGYGECVPGNKNGPYFRQDCLDWQYIPRNIYRTPRPIPVYKRPFWRWRRSWW